MKENKKMFTRQVSSKCICETRIIDIKLFCLKILSNQCLRGGGWFACVLAAYEMLSKTSADVSRDIPIFSSA